MRELGVTFIMGSRVTRIHADGISCEKNGEQLRLEGFDRVVLAFGSRPNRELWEAYRDDPRVHVIGDAHEAADAKKGIYEATKLALRL